MNGLGSLRWSPVLFAIALTGCQAAPRSQPGTATLSVRVTAEPKKGYKTPTIAGGDYGGDGGVSAASSTGSFAVVDYRRVGNVIVMLEPDGAVQLPAPATTPRATSTEKSSAGGEAPLVTVAVRDDSSRSGSQADTIGDVYPATVGSRIRVVNAGGRAQTIYSLSPGNEFDLGAIPSGGSGEALVRAPGLIELLCESRETPVGWVYASKSPWIQRTDSRSSVIFANVAPGSYRVNCWHPRLPASSTTVQLVADRTAQV